MAAVDQPLRTHYRRCGSEFNCTSGNITLDAQENNIDIIFKGTYDTTDITMLTLDGSDEGTAYLNRKQWYPYHYILNIHSPYHDQSTTKTYSTFTNDNNGIKGAK